MLDDFYQRPEETADWRALRTEGYLGDASICLSCSDWLKLEDLPPVLRTLLVTDGTVTKVLEAYFWEPVEVMPLRLEVVRTTQAIPWLMLASDEEVLTRRVELRGVRSGKAYAEAFSVVTLAAFDPPLRDALVRGSVGIGVLLRESGLETYREIVAVGAIGESVDDKDLRVHRTYRITRDNKPVILIRESFPRGLYQSTSL